LTPKLMKHQGAPFMVVSEGTVFRAGASVAVVDGYAARGGFVRRLGGVPAAEVEPIGEREAMVALFHEVFREQLAGQSFEVPPVPPADPEAES
jgi:hypothetical protein